MGCSIDKYIVLHDASTYKKSPNRSTFSTTWYSMWNLRVKWFIFSKSPNACSYIFLSILTFSFRVPIPYFVLVVSHLEWNKRFRMYEYVEWKEGNTGFSEQLITLSINGFRNGNTVSISKEIFSTLHTFRSRQREEYVLRRSFLTSWNINVEARNWNLSIIRGKLVDTSMNYLFLALF